MNGNPYSGDPDDSDPAAYYDENAVAFIESTRNVDLRDHYDRFLLHLAPGSRILDAGCGAGRDSLAFARRGHAVVAIDSSIEMVRATREFAGVPAEHVSFLEFRPDRQFDGIWACASLLHLSWSRLVANVRHLTTLLRNGGVLYMSFKLGDGEGRREGRFFRDLNEDLLAALVNETPSLELRERWRSSDGRPDRDGLWLNAIALVRRGR